MLEDSAAPLVSYAWTPKSLTSSPGATAIFDFNANDASQVPAGADGVVSAVYNSLNPAQYLRAEVASGGDPVVVAQNSGAGGSSRVLQFHPTRIDPNLYDPSTNWLGAGGVNGTAGAALVNLANSSDIGAVGDFTTIVALKIDTAYRYEAGPIWGTLASPGPLQYAQLRINPGAGVQGADITPPDLTATNASGAITAGWHVMTMIKHDATLTYRLDGKLVQAATIASHASFTATDFMIGGGFPQGSLANPGQENGVPPAALGDFQAYSGVLAGSDLANAEAVAGSSIGLSIGSVGAEIWLPDTSTVYAANAGDTVHGGIGAATVTAAGGSVLLLGGSGPLWFIGGAGSNTVSGASGRLSVIGGSGGGSFTAGTAGSSVLVAGGGNSSLKGGGEGDRLFGSATGQDFMAAGAGHESLIGGSGNSTIQGGATAGAVIFTTGNSTVSGGVAGSDTVVGGAGGLNATLNSSALFAGSGATMVTGGTAGADSVIGGSGSLTVTGRGGNMLVVGGSGAAAITTGNGANLIFGGAGAMSVTEGTGPATVVGGQGSVQVNQGGGPMTYDLVKGQAGGSLIVAGYRPGIDQVVLYGYGAETPQIQYAGGNSVLSLSDGSHVTLIGITVPGQILSV